MGSFRAPIRALAWSPPQTAGWISAAPWSYTGLQQNLCAESLSEPAGIGSQAWGQLLVSSWRNPSHENLAVKMQYTAISVYRTGVLYTDIYLYISVCRYMYIRIYISVYKQVFPFMPSEAA